MATNPLLQYLKMHRKRSGLTQEDVARLFGVSTGTMISQYERSERVPTLDAALRLEAIFGVAVVALFRGRHARIRTELRREVRLLLRRTQKVPQTAASERKVAFLAALLVRAKQQDG